jgi:hypothetical protein
LPDALHRERGFLGKGLGLGQGPEGDPETDRLGAPHVGDKPGPVGGAQVEGAEEPVLEVDRAAAADDADESVRRSDRVGLVERRVGTVPVVAPLADAVVQVREAPSGAQGYFTAFMR